ncbi:MAG: response regulator [Dethiobacter sp.]|nr:response regulator [Dethiobacter sp.]MBS3990048.1 response regulator [Dethiobacter sp.]
MEKIKLLIVDDIAQTRKDITRLLYFEDDMTVVGEAGDGAEALEKMAELQPDVVLMDINMPQTDGITATEKACQLYPQVAVVIISIQSESEYLKKAMVAGARDYLVKPLSSEEMATTIRSVYKQQQLRTSQLSHCVGILAAGGGEHPPQREYPVSAPTSNQSARSDEKPLGHVSVFFSGKGGAGKTTIATNLAVVIAQQGKKRVALVDYDLQFGDIAVMLNLTEGKNISDLAREEGLLTTMKMDCYLIRHFSGVDILSAPLFPQDAEYVKPRDTEQILRLLKESYDYIIVDTAATFDEVTLLALEMADLIHLVVTRDISTIKNAKTSLKIMESLDYRDKVRVVLNRSDQDLGVEIADLEKGLEIAVAHQITSDEKAATSAINKGVPVVISHPAAEISRSFRRLGERILSGRRVSLGERQGKGMISRIFSL